MTPDPAGETRRPAEVLLLEDSPSDRLLMTLALEECDVPHRLHVTEYGTDALRFLRREPPFEEVPRPDLILLDLNVPRMDGRDLLRRIKADPSLRTIPVVVLTTSTHPADIRTAYEHHANCYLRKSADYAVFAATVRDLMRFWCRTIVPPPEPTADAPAPTRVSSRRRLLLVEDSPSDAALVRAALADVVEPAHEITHVTRLVHALEALRADHFDLIVTDLSLPDAEGVDTVRLLSAAAGSTPIIVLTGSYADVGEAVLSAGADDFLPKNDLAGARLDRLFRHAIRRRNLQEDELQAQRVRVVGRLAASVAHDMNNLLAAIRLAAEESAATHGPDESLVLEILGHVDRGTAITRQLLAFGRRSEGGRVRCELNGAVTSAAAMVSRLLRRDVVLDIALTSGATPVLADVHQVEQVVANLAINASDAMDRGGRLTIATAIRRIEGEEGARFDPALPPGRYAALTVADTGPGIAADVLPHIFEPFFTTKAEHEGTGLGLASVRDIVRAHRGGVAVANRPGGGALFTVLLPLHDDEVPRGERVRTPPVPMAAVAPGPSIGATGSAPAILLAEDEVSVARAMQRILTLQGYAVTIVDSADAAWRAWTERQGGFDAIVSDVFMPGAMTVVELVDRVRAERPSLPIVICSGFPGTENIAALGLVEGVNFVPKPFRGEALVQVVQRQLASATG